VYYVGSKQLGLKVANRILVHSCLHKFFKMSKQDFFKKHNIKYIDYKDVEILRQFLNPHGRILPRRATGLSAKHQRSLAKAVKRAREMGLLPYIIY